MRVPALLIGASILTIALAVLVSGESLRGTVVDANSQIASWAVNSELFQEGSLWIVELELPDTLPDYLYDTDTGEPMKFPTSMEAREYAISFLKELGYV